MTLTLDPIPPQVNISTSSEVAGSETTVSEATVRWLEQAPKKSSLATVAEAEVTEERLLRFALPRGESALLPLSSVQEVLKIPKQGLLRVPEMHPSILGVSNCRGSILWMVDLALLLGLDAEATQVSEQSWQPSIHRTPKFLNTIAIQSAGSTLGLVVSRVMDIETYSAEQVQPPSTDLFSAELMPFLLGYLSQGCSPIFNASTLIENLQLQR